MNLPVKALLTLLSCLAGNCASASNIVILGRLVSNEPMSYVKDECPEDSICMRSWWKSVIKVEQTVRGQSLSGRVTTAVMQHTALNARFKKTVRLFILEPIEDPEERAKLRADYYLEESSEPQQVFCLLRDPKTFGLNVKETYVLNANDLTTYCFGLPDK